MSIAVIEEAAPRQGRRAYAPEESLEPAAHDLEPGIVDADVPDAGGSETPDTPQELVEAVTIVDRPATAVESTKGYPYLAETVEELVRGQLEAGTARSIGAAAAFDRGLSPKAADLLTALLVLSATDLSRGTPWDSHRMSQRDWFEGFLFEDVAGWLNDIGSPYSFRAFRTAMYSNDALAAFNSMPALARHPGVREEVDTAIRHFAGSLERAQQLFAAAGV